MASGVASVFDILEEATLQASGGRLAVVSGLASGFDILLWPVVAAVVPGSAESIHDLIMSIIPVVGGVAASTAVFVIVKRVLRSI
jgi:hypothetical protein